MARIISIILITITFLFSLPLAFAQDTTDADVAQQAEIAYTSGDYQTATALYSTLIQRGVQDFSIYYNAGSAFYQNGDLGQALYYFSQAQALNPRSQTLNLNIARIRAERVDYLPESRQVLDVIGTATVTFMTLGELQILSLILWTSGFIIGGIYFLRRSLWQRLRVLQWIVGVMIVICLVLMASRMLLVTSRPLAVVTIPVTQVMSGPGEDYLPLYRLFSAAELRITKTQSGWARFTLGDGRHGWIQLEAISSLDD